MPIRTIASPRVASPGPGSRALPALIPELVDSSGAIPGRTASRQRAQSVHTLPSTAQPATERAEDLRPRESKPGRNERSRPAGLAVLAFALAGVVVLGSLAAFAATGANALRAQLEAPDAEFASLQRSQSILLAQNAVLQAQVDASKVTIRSLEQRLSSLELRLNELTEARPVSPLATPTTNPKATPAATPSAPEPSGQPGTLQ